MGRHSAPDTYETVQWLAVMVDEEGNITVIDVIEGYKAKPFGTVMMPPARWAEDIQEAVLDVMDQAGLNITDRSFGA